MVETRRPQAYSDLRVLVIEHEPIVDPALIGERLALADATVTLYGPHLDPELPRNLEDFDALIVLGGSMGPLEDEKAPWLPGVRELMALALETNVPMLGICLGAQLLATVAGSEVAPIEDGPEVGLVELQVTPAGHADPLLSALGDASLVQAVQWHWLEAKTLPAGSTPLVTTEACTNQAFRIGESAWGLQFHLEALTYTARNWSDESAVELDELGIDAEAQIISVVEDAEPELRETWSRVIDRFIEIAAGRSVRSA